MIAALYFPQIYAISVLPVHILWLNVVSHRTCSLLNKCRVMVRVMRSGLCVTSRILANNQLDALFHVFIYFISLHVSSITVLIIRRSNCINKSSGMISLCKWLLGMSVRREIQFPPDRHTKQSLTQTNHTGWCINTIRSPDDEHCDARNM